MKKITFSIIVAVSCMFNEVGAQVVTIYSDTFGGTGSEHNQVVENSVVNASTYGGTTGAAWKEFTSGTFTENGGKLDVSLTGTSMVGLSLQPVSGHRYVISSEVTHTADLPASGSGWLGIGIGTQAAGALNALWDNSAYMILQRGSTGGTNITTSVQGNGSNFTLADSTNPVTLTLSMILDTTVPAWTVSFYNGNLQVGTTRTLSSNLSFNSVSLGVSGATGSFDNFVVAVPEPKTYAMIMVAFLGFVIYRKSLLKKASI